MNILTVLWVTEIKRPVELFHVKSFIIEFFLYIFLILILVFFGVYKIFT